MRKKLLVKQRDIRDCGACCLLSIIRHFDGDLNLEQIRLDTKTNSNGTTAFNIIKAAQKYGFNGVGKRIEAVNDIKSFPVIAHVITKKGYEHFVVIYRLQRNKLLIMDPAKGFVNVKVCDFLEIWDKVILILRPYKRIINNPINSSLYSYIIYIYRKEKRLFYKLLVDSIIVALLSLISAMYWQFIFNNNRISNSIFYISFFFFIITILRVLVIKKKNYWQIVLNKRIDSDIVLSFIKQIFNLPLDIIRNRSAGEILTRVNEIKEIKDLVSNVLITLFLEFFLALCSIYVLVLISKRLIIIVIFIIILYLLISIIMSPIIYKRTNDIIDLETDFNASLNENIESINTIRNLNIGDFVLNKIQRFFYIFQNESFDYQYLMNNYIFFKNLIYEIGLFAINTYGFYLIAKQDLSIVQLVTFNTVLAYVFGPIIDIIDNIPKISMIRLIVIKVKEILDIKVKDMGEEEAFHNGIIIFDNVSYSYDDYHHVLNKVNISINDGERVMIKGKSGIGKSTLLQLLSGNIENYTGRILINDINIKDYSMATIKKNIRYVSQKESLFTGNLKENIVFDNNYDIDYLNKVIKVTKLDEVLDKKELRFNTLIVDGGANISGGERQRIILARSIIDKPAILILDEALSEVDSDLEKDILNQLDKFLVDTTIIYISHHKEIVGFKVLNLEEAH